MMEPGPTEDVVDHTEGHVGKGAAPSSCGPSRRARRTHPLYIRPGGRRQQPLLRKQYRPIETAVLLAGAAPELEFEGAWTDRVRSPRIITSGWMTVLPPSMMFWVPTSVALRATLLPVSWGC